MADSYITKSGDAWDAIAQLVYGDEKYMSHLMQANPEYLHIFLFSSVTILRTPPLPTVEGATNTPIWRTVQ